MRSSNGFKGLLVAVLAMSLLLAACASGDGANGSGNAVNGGTVSEPAANGSAGNNAGGTPATEYSEGQEDEAQRWEGEWRLKDASESRGSIITIQAPQGDRVAFMLDAFYLGNPDDENATPNIGNIPDGEAVVSGNTATFADESLGFTLVMKRVGEELIVESTQGTGYFGQGVYVDGAYVRAEAP